MLKSSPSTTRPGLVLAVALLAASLSTAGWSQSAELHVGAANRSAAAPAAAPLRLADRTALAPLAELRAAPDAELAAIATWNRGGRLPLKNGFSRPLALASRVAFGSELANRSTGNLAGGTFERQTDGSLVWAGAVRVDGAYRTRLHLADLNLPAGSQLWVYSDQEVAGPFGLELKGPDGDLWTPSVTGGDVRLEVRLPAGAPAHSAFTLDRVLEVVELADGAPVLQSRGATPPCLVDAQCVSSATFDVVDLAQRAVALIQFVDQGSSFLCSGGLLNDTENSETPYFLTANHCFDTQASASTLEAFWDYYSASCNGSVPTVGSLPRSNGATLLASNPTSDFTFVQLTSVPSGRVFLGWNADPASIPNGTVLHRLSHPQGLHQHYSRNHVDTTALTCTGASRPNFIYESYMASDTGGTFGGSSGSPAILAGGQVVGQLTGGCGPNPQDGCDYDNAEVDGAFSVTFNSVSQYLAASGTSCIPGPNTMCLVSGRFEVTLDYRIPQTATAAAHVVAAGSDNAGMFYFNNAANWEMLLKVLNGCSLNGRYWVFYAATTNIEFTLTVTDTSTGDVKTYFNPQGTAAAPVQDTTAFATCP